MHHDAHHATLVACASGLRRALGPGGRGTGLASGAEDMVRDAMHAIEGAAKAKDVLPRDQGKGSRFGD